jgi:hypothetical protein
MKFIDTDKMTKPKPVNSTEKEIDAAQVETSYSKDNVPAPYGKFDPEHMAVIERPKSFTMLVNRVVYWTAFLSGIYMIWVSATEFGSMQGVHAAVVAFAMYYIQMDSGKEYSKMLKNKRIYDMLIKEAKNLDKS